MSSRRLIILERALWLWIDAVMARARLVLTILVLLAVIGVALAVNLLGVNADTSRMVSSNLDYRVAHLDLQSAFPDQDNQVTLIVRGRSPDEADAFTELAVEKLRARPDAVVDVFAPSVMEFFLKNGLLYLDLDELDEVLPKISEAAPLIKRLGEDPTLDELYDALWDATQVADGEPAAPEALSDAFNAMADVILARLDGRPMPLAWQELFGADDDGVERLNQRIVTITPKLNFADLQPARVAVDAIAEIIAEINAAGEFEVEAGLTGTVALRSEELRSVSQGIGWSLLASLFFVAAALAFALRSPALVLAALLSLVVSISITAGIAALLFDDLNLVSVAFTVLMVGLGIDFAIHMALHVQEERKGGRRARTALYRTTRHIGAALALCAPTSALAFFSFAPTQFTGMTQLGVVSGFGVLVAFIVSVTLLPAVFSLLPQMRRPGRIRKPRSWDFSADGGRLRSACVYCTLALGVGALALAPQVRFDADPMSLRDPAAPTVQAFNLLFDDEDTQPFTLSILEETVEAGEATAARLEALPEVRRVITLQDFVPQDQWEKLDIIEFAATGLSLAFESSGAVPREADALPPLDRLMAALAPLGDRGSQRLLAALARLEAEADPDLERALAKDVFRFWPAQLERLRLMIQPQPIEIADLPQGVRDRYVSDDGRVRVQIEPVADLRGAAERAAFVNAVRAEDPRASGPARSVLESGQVISQAMLIATAAAFLAVSFTLWLILRDELLVAVILFCLLLAGVLTMAASVLLDMPFNFTNVIVLPLLIGVGADSGIHLGMRARKAQEVRRIYETATPSAVFFSAITTIGSFGTLAFSAHRGVASMGALLTIAICFTLICTIVVQPWLLERFGHRHKQLA